MYPANLDKSRQLPFRFLPLDRTAYVRDLSGSQAQIQENVVKDWLLAQRYADPGEESYVARRDLSIRRIEVSNSGTRPILVKITTDANTVVAPSELTYPVHFQGDVGRPRGMDYVRSSGQDFPGTSLTVRPGTSFFIGVGPKGAPQQFAHILDPRTQIPIGQPIAIREDLQILVAREGNQGWFFQAMRSTGFKAQ